MSFPSFNRPRFFSFFFRPVTYLSVSRKVSEEGFRIKNISRYNVIRKEFSGLLDVGKTVYAKRRSSGRTLYFHD